MIELTNIQLQCFSKIFSKNTKKLIRFSYKNTSNTSKNIAVIVNEATIKWVQPLKLPQVYNQDIDFEIYGQHQFGYNPEELQNLLYGAIKVSEGKSIGKGEVYSSQENGKRIGQIVFDIKRTSKKKKEGQKQEVVEPKVTKILSSVLIRNLENSPASGYINVFSDSKNYKSQIVQAVDNQFVFNMNFKKESYLVKSSNPNEKIIITFYTDDGVQFGKAAYFFSSKNKLYKTDLENQSNNKKVGEVYFQIDFIQNQEPKKVSEIAPSSFQQVQDKGSAHPSAEKAFNSQANLRSVSMSRLTRLGESQLLSTSRKKKVSVFHHNNDIFFPSEKRFMIYEDKQTNIISYSKLPSMKFEDQQSKKYYKGASIGVGTKSDFTIYYRSNPGVGQYKLPSIFDRY